MRLAMFTDGRFYRDGSRRYYTRSNWRRVLLSEYARTFGELRVFCRCSERDLSGVPADEIIDVPEIGFCPLPAFSGRLGYLRVRRCIVKSIRRHLPGCDACFLRIPGQISTAGIAVARALRIPTVCQLVGDGESVFRTDETLVPTRFLRGLAARLAYRHQYSVTNKCDGQTAISANLARKYCRYPDEVAIVPNTLINADWLLPFRPRRADEPFNALYVGRLEHHKNVQLFLQAAAELEQEGRNFRSTIVGTGAYLPTLQRMATELGVADRIDFVGHVGSRRRLREYYRQAHALYLLSLTEGLGMVLIEAGAASLPIVGSRRGGIPELARDGENAFLVEPDDVRGCVAAIGRLMDDEALRERMARRGHELMQDYTLERVVARAANVIRKVTEEHRK